MCYPKNDNEGITKRTYVHTYIILSINVKDKQKRVRAVFRENFLLEICQKLIKR